MNNPRVNKIKEEISEMMNCSCYVDEKLSEYRRLLNLNPDANIDTVDHDIKAMKKRNSYKNGITIISYGIYILLLAFIIRLIAEFLTWTIFVETLLIISKHTFLENMNIFFGNSSLVGFIIIIFGFIYMSS